ncbi:MAG: T9SS type A sorting domain-containing protein [Chitinophagales bacterium]|nr:T9SS type A sorting domain-containing protein [Chitinophagales bacterium]
MKNTNLKYIINLFLIGFTHFTMNATGLSGAAITYQLIDTNQGRYKITLEYYMICAHGIIESTQEINIVGSPSVSKMTVFYIKKEEISPIGLPPDVISSKKTYCNSNGPEEVKGYYKATYEGTVVIGKNIGLVIFGWVDCCRDIAITNHSEPSSSLFVQAAVNTNHLNSSPIHSRPEMIQLYKNKQNRYNMRATDIYDPKHILIGGKMVIRDSLAYELIPSFTSMAANATSVANLQNPFISYKSGLSATQCFYTSPPMTINHALAQVNINPDRDQLGHMVYVVREYRAIPNSAGTSYTRVLVGYTMRDVVLGAYGTADPVVYDGIIKNLSLIDTLFNNYTAGTCAQENKIVFKAIGAPYRALKIKDLSVIEASIVSNYKMSYTIKSGNNVDTAYVTLSYRKKKEVPSLNFLFDAYYVNTNGIQVSHIMPIVVLPGNGFVQLAEDTVYYCSSGSIRLDATIGVGAKWSPLISAVAINSDTSIIDVAPTVGRWYKASNLATPASCKLNDSVYIKVQTCDTVYGVMCIDRNKNCICDPWEFRVPNTSFEVKGVSNVYNAIVTTDSSGAYSFIPPSLNSYHIENDGMLFNCGVNNKKSRAFTMTLFGNMKVDIPVLDSVVISKFTTAMIDTNYCFGESVPYEMYFFKNYGLMRAIMHYGDGQVDTIKNYGIDAGFIYHSFLHKYVSGGQHTAKIVFLDFFYTPKDSFIFRPILFSNCVYGKLFIDGNKDCSYQSNDKLLADHRLDFKNNVTGDYDFLFTLSDGSYKSFIKKNQAYTLSNAIPIMCNSNSTSKTIPAFSVDTTLKMDLPLDPVPVNYILVVQKSGSIANNKKLSLNLSYAGYYFTDTAIKKYEVRLPAMTKVDAISSNATYTQSGTILQIIQNTGTKTSLTLKFDSLAGNDTLCFFVRLHKVITETDTTDNSQYFCLKEGEKDLALNQKQVSIKSQINHEDFLNKTDELIYQINFINNRTSLANHVYISDIIDNKLDMNSFKLIKQSHAGQILFRAGNELVFTFKDINLPDSVSNDSASRGYVIFSLKPKSSLAVNDIITNQAVIVLDFTQNIRTNTTLSRYITKPTVSIYDFHKNEHYFYPNPASNYINIDIDNSLSKFSVSITSIDGRKIAQFFDQTKIPVESLPRGTYFLELRVGDIVKVEKLILR